MFQAIRKKLILIIFLAVAAAAILLPCTAAADGNSESFVSTGWSGTVSNVSITSFEVKPEFKLHIKTKLKVIPTGGSVTINFRIKIGVKGDFDVTFSRPSLPDGLDINTKITGRDKRLLKYNLGDGLFKDIPKELIDYSMKMELLGGASQPCRVRGSFTNYVELTVGTSGISTGHNTEFTFTSIEPKEPDKETFVFVGANVVQNYGAGKVGWKKLSFGPVLKVSANFMAGGQAVATLHKDEWKTDENGRYIGITDSNPEPDVIHSCTEKGKAGCVSGKVCQVRDMGGTVSANLTAAKIKIIGKDWTIGSDYQKRGIAEFCKSLTWGERIGYAAECRHMYYRVPVQVWADETYTTPVPEASVFTTDPIRTDANMEDFVSGITGSGRDIASKYSAPKDAGPGRANLYLPYKDGRYTIVGTKSGLKGIANQPSAMRRGSNDPIDIVLSSGEKINVTAEKKWDIDFEDKDRPDEVEVILQRNSYNNNASSGYYSWVGVDTAKLNAENNWQHTFEGLPWYELDADGTVHEIRYRVRELRPAETGNADNDAPYQEDANNIRTVTGAVAPDSTAGTASYSLRVVNDETDLDNIHIANALKDDYSAEALWGIPEDKNALQHLEETIEFVTPYVVYPVEEYTSVTGETVEKHNTRYQVTYETEEISAVTDSGLTETTLYTTITNTAVLDMNITKLWRPFGDPGRPYSVYLALCYRVQPEYRNAVPDTGNAVKNYGGEWIPVWNPLSGGTNLFTLKEPDLPGGTDVPLAVAEVTKTDDEDSWSTGFEVRKYGFLNADGVPVEFLAAEITDAVLSDVLTPVTDSDSLIAISSLDSTFASIPGRMGHDPDSDREWVYSGSVINIRVIPFIPVIPVPDVPTPVVPVPDVPTPVVPVPDVPTPVVPIDPDDDPDDPDEYDDFKPSAIGGIKYWLNDTDADRPDTLTIVVRGRLKGVSGAPELTKRITLKKADQYGLNNWVWTLKNTNRNVQAWLISLKVFDSTIDEKTISLNDSRFEWSVSEEFPAGFAGADAYSCMVDGFSLYNTKAGERKEPEVVIVKTFEETIPAGEGTNYEFELLLDGTVVGTVSGDDARGANGRLVINVPGSFRGKNISRMTVSERFTGSGSPDWISEVSGPVLSVKSDGTPVYTFTVNNRYARSTVKIVIRKEWAKGTTPEGVMVNVLQDGKAIQQVTLNAANNWQAEVTSLPAMNTATGKAYGYTVEEAVSDRYTSAASVTAGKDGTQSVIQYILTNSLSNIELKITKVWNDEDNEMKNRPLNGTVLADVYADGELLTGDGFPVQITPDAGADRKTVTVTLPACAGGKEISYTVKEHAPVKGYRTAVTGSMAEGFTITNTPEKTDIRVSKTWDDENDRNGKRPASVTVRLYAVSGETRKEAGAAQLSAENGWEYVFRGMSLYMNGAPCTYEVTEDAVSGYTAAVSGDAENGFEIINTAERGQELTVTKIWSNGYKGRTWSDGDRDIPSSVTIEVLQRAAGEETWTSYATMKMTSADLLKGGDGVPVRTSHEHDQWQRKIIVPVNDENGRAYEYDVKEPDTGSEIASRVQRSGAYDFTVINQTGTRKINAYTVNVVWEDMENRYGLRPGYVTTSFVFSDKGPGDYLAIDEQEYWRAIYETERTVDGVAADSVSSYTSKVVRNSEYSYTIYYQLTPPAHTEVTVTKVWNDAGDRNGKRPESITVGLYRQAAGESSPQLIRTQKLTEANGWTWTFDNLESREIGGKEDKYTYSIQEMSKAEGYDVRIRSDKEDVSSTGNTYLNYTIINTFPMTDVKVTKVWDDAGIDAVIRPEYVEVILLADGTEADRMILTEEDGWKGTFRNRAKLNDEGMEIVYTIEEEQPGGYEAPVITGSAGNGFIVKNTARTQDITVTKVWDDDDDRRGKRPDSVTITLFANDTEMGSFEAGAGRMTHTFTGMPVKDAQGQDVIFRIEEEEPDGYRASVTGDAESGFTVINTFITADITVTKEWDDGNDQSKRPASIRVTLWCDAEKEDEMAPVKPGGELIIRADSETGAWTGRFEGMPVFAEGNRVIQYSVEEDEIPDYGEPLYTQFGYDFTIYNRLLEEDTVVIVDKEWERAEGMDIPDSVTVHLLRDGKPIPDTEGGDKAKTITGEAEADGDSDLAAPWRVVWTDVPRHILTADEDHIYKYTVSEDAVPGFRTEIFAETDPEGSHHMIQIVNTAMSAPVTLEGTKVITGREMTEDDVFAFGLYDESGNLIRKAENDAEGRFVFEPVRYTAEDAGTRVYTVKEIPGSGNGLAFDPTVYTVTVKVTADDTGFVTAEVSENAENLVFTNTYEAKGSITFAGRKSITGRDLTADDIFTYEISEIGTDRTWTVQNDSTGKILYPEIMYVLNDTTDDTGLHTYEIREADTDQDGILKDETVYTVSVNVQDNGKGKLEAVADESAEALDFTNEYCASVSVTFEGTKQMAGRDMAEDDIYTFEITETGTGRTWTVQNTPDGQIPYPKITYYKSLTVDDTGVHTYRVREADTDGDGVTIDYAVYTVTVEVTADAKGQLQAEVSDNATTLDFVNRYGITGSVTFRGTKTVSGREWAEDDIYTFEVMEPGTDNRWTVQNDSTGKILYPTIWYAKNELQDDTGIHTYLIREADTDGDGVSIDTREYTVTVEVTDDEWGNLIADAAGDAWSLDFVNEYNATGSITFEGTKTVTGRAWQDDDIYIFEVREKGDGETNLWIVQNDETGKILYPEIRYTQADAGQHIYEVREIDPDEEGLMTDRTVYTVVVDVEDDGWGNLTVTSGDNAKKLDFVNHYGAFGSVTFAGTKKIEGRAWTDDDIYTFEILEKDTLNRWTVENDLTGKIRFPEIEYVKNDERDDTGTHTYYIREIYTDVEGIQADNRLYEVTVEVADNGTGKLAVKAGRNAKALDFENRYGATGSFYFSGDKLLEGTKMTEDDIFLFEIAETGTENKWYVTSTENGAILYPRIGFIRNNQVDEIGKHTYTVREVDTGREDMVYSDVLYTMTVEVKDNGNGTLNVITTDDSRAMDFINTPKYRITYDPNGGVIDGQKDPVYEMHAGGEVITIRNAPTRNGYRFLYWQGSAYQPGDKYTVTSDHVFVAQWERIGNPSPYTHRFSFTKEWSGGREDSIEWTLYKGDGTEAHKKFNRKIITDSEWYYEAWFESDEDYYVIEDVPAGYQVRYENAGIHAGETDRCYNGGIIINYRVPKTADDASLILWTACVAIGLAGIVTLLILRKRRADR